MRAMMMGAGIATVLALAACGERRAEEANRAETAGPEATENQLAAMPEGQRNAVFIRAIRDAGQECQHVESSVRAGEHQGLPVWSAQCDDGSSWTIVITSDGTAAVLNEAEARLVDSNQAAPQNKQ